jgi:hypothetical protein
LFGRIDQVGCIAAQALVWAAIAVVVVVRRGPLFAARQMG